MVGRSYELSHIHKKGQRILEQVSSGFSFRERLFSSSIFPMPIGKQFPNLLN